MAIVRRQVVDEEGRVRDCLAIESWPALEPKAPAALAHWRFEKIESGGLEADKRGRLTVDENFRTSVPHIYAAGDVTGQMLLSSGIALACYGAVLGSFHGTRTNVGFRAAVVQHETDHLFGTVFGDRLLFDAAADEARLAGELERASRSFQSTPRRAMASSQARYSTNIRPSVTVRG